VDIRAAFTRGSPLILDGGLATELERRGHTLTDGLWSARVLIDAPDAIEAIHHDFFAAGAACVTSASYQASYRGFAERGISRAEATHLLERSVGLAVTARARYIAERPTNAPPARDLLVAASVGPYGATLHDGSEYRGDYRLSERELTEFHGERLAVLANAGPDLFACETIPQLREAVAIERALRDVPFMNAWVTFSSLDGVHTPAGEALSVCGSVLADSDQIVAIGVNCLAPELVSSCLRALRRSTDKPLVVYPNVAGTWDPQARRWRAPQRFEAVLDRLPEWLELGVRAVGGCCGTTPEDIQRLVTAAGNGGR
jgi:homocysteine S-methyltransferase